MNYYTLENIKSNEQFLLGEIYYKYEYISRDINKSIHYFTLPEIKKSFQNTIFSRQNLS